MTDPVNIATERAYRTGDPKDWSVRDMLVDAIRRIDEGEINPTLAVVAMNFADKEGGTSIGYTRSGGSQIEVVGTLAIVKDLLVGD